MLLGMEVGLGPGDFVLYGIMGIPLSLPKRPPAKKKFGHMFIAAKRLDG